jgi:hypothetical protein
MHRGSSGSDYYYESYEEDEYVETEVEVEVTDSEPEPSKVLIFENASMFIWQVLKILILGNFILEAVYD